MSARRSKSLDRCPSRSSSSSCSDPPNPYELEDSYSDSDSNASLTWRKRKTPGGSKGIPPDDDDDDDGTCKPKPRPLPTATAYQLTREQKQCTLLLSAAIRHCLLPGFSRAITAIFGDAYSEEQSMLNPPDPIELIDLRSREASIRLKFLIKSAFEQIYSRLLVIGVEEVVAADGLKTVVDLQDLQKLLASGKPLSAEALSSSGDDNSDSDSASSRSDDDKGGDGIGDGDGGHSSDSNVHSDSCSCKGNHSDQEGSADEEAKSDEEEDEEGDEEEDEEDEDEDSGPDYEAMFKEMRVYNRCPRRSRHYKSLPGYRSSRRKILKLRMLKKREQADRQQSNQNDQENSSAENGEDESEGKNEEEEEVKDERQQMESEKGEGKDEKGNQSRSHPRSPSSAPPCSAASQSESSISISPLSPPPTPPQVTASIKVRKMIALVISQAMVAAIGPSLERLIWTLRNDHVRQMDPDEVLPVDLLLRNYGLDQHINVDFSKLKSKRRRLEANILHSKERQKFRRAVFDTFFADPARSSNPQTLANESPYICPTTLNDLGVERLPNLSHLQRHLMSAVMVAVRSGFILLLEQRIVLEISSKYDIRLEKVRYVEAEFASFTDADLEDDDGNVALDQSVISPLKGKHSCLSA